MADTTNIEAPKWTASQNQPDVTMNSALDVIDTTVAGQNIVDVGSDADYTLVATGTRPQEWQYCVIEMTDTGVVLTGAINVIVPDNQRMYFVYNNTAETLTFKTAAGTGAAVLTTVRAIVQCDGTNVVAWF
jgi:hypothetical protein